MKNQEGNIEYTRTLRLSLNLPNVGAKFYHEQTTRENQVITATLRDDGRLIVTVFLNKIPEIKQLLDTIDRKDYWTEIEKT